MTGSTSPDQPEALPAARDSATLLLAVLGQSAMSRTRTAHAALELKPRQFEAIATLHDLGPMTQTELGDALGISVVHVNRTLQKLRRDGLISFKSKRLKVLDWKRLSEIGDFDPTYLHLTPPPPA